MAILILPSPCNIARCKFDILMPPLPALLLWRRLEKNLQSRTEFYRMALVTGAARAAAVSAVKCSFALLSAISRGERGPFMTFSPDAQKGECAIIKYRQ